MSIVQLRLTRRQVQDSGASAEGRRPGAKGRICLTGWVDEADKPALYALALGSVFVSEYEGFGLPVVEGMGCNKEAGASPSSAPACKRVRISTSRCCFSFKVMVLIPQVCGHYP